MGDTRFDSWCRFGPNRAPSLSPLAVFAAAGLCLLGPATVLGGSIFMKNGYIIQGPIVEHREGGEGCVVLGWPHGKVTIYRRFIERVDFEPGEELAAKTEEVPADPAVAEDVIIAPGGEDELPRDLSELVRAYKLPPSLIDGKIPPPASAAGDPETPETTVTVVPHPAAEPGTTQEGAVAAGPAGTEAAAVPPADVPVPPAATNRVTESEWGFSIELPPGWVRTDGPGIIGWTGPAGADGLVPSLNISTVAAASLPWNDACKALREDQAASVRGYNLIGDETLEISGRPAYRVAGQGTAAGPAPEGRKVVIRQSILEKNGKYWLISTFAPAERQVEVAELLDRTVSSFHLDA